MVWAAIMVCGGLLTGLFLILLLQSAFGLVLLIYIPAAIILCRKRSKSRFDQAGGEVAYLVVQAGISISE